MADVASESLGSAEPPSSAGLLGCAQPLAQAYRLALVDLDGVTYRGQDPIENAAAGLAEARSRGMAVCFVTNNASRTPQQVADQLVGLGIAAEATEVLTSAAACAALLKSRLRAGAKVLLVGGRGLREAVVDAGFTVVHSAGDAPDAVAQGFAPEVGWPDLAEAAYAVGNGAWYVASNLDMSIPLERGFAPGNGALVGAVYAACGVWPDAWGKPSPKIYELAVARSAAGASPASNRRADTTSSTAGTLVIGDRLSTDIAGAREAGYPGLLVLTGVSTGRDAILASPGERPNYLGADLSVLLSPHPQPRLDDDGWWVCGGRRVRIVAGDTDRERAGIAEPTGTLELDRDGPTGLDVLRAACAAAWASADAGLAVNPDTVPEFLA